MNLLITGVLLWSVLHLLPTLAPGFRQGMIDRLGAGPWRGVFSLALVGSLVLIVSGWRSTPEEFVYILPVWSRWLTFGLMFVAFVFLGASHGRSSIKYLVRHPMLTGVVLWSAAHLLVNGTTRAFILFGVLGLWALIEIPLVNARDGARDLSDAGESGGVVKVVLISAVVFGVVLFLHPWFTGVSPLPM